MTEIGTEPDERKASCTLRSADVKLKNSDEERPLE
jgi:hypothetical protein